MPQQDTTRGNAGSKPPKKRKTATRGRRVLIAVFVANVARFDLDVHWPAAAWTHVDTGPLAGLCLCLRCDVPVSRHPARLR